MLNESCHYSDAGPRDLRGFRSLRLLALPNILVDAGIEGRKPLPPPFPVRSARYNPVPGRGIYASISTAEGSFDCHINLSKVCPAPQCREPPFFGCFATTCAPFCPKTHTTPPLTCV